MLRVLPHPNQQGCPLPNNRIFFLNFIYNMVFGSRQKFATVTHIIDKYDTATERDTSNCYICKQNVPACKVRPCYLDYFVVACNHLNYYYMCINCPFTMCIYNYIKKMNLQGRYPRQSRVTDVISSESQ